MDWLTWPWALAIIGGFIILGGVIGYGVARTAHRSPQERAARDEGTREVYREDESESRGNWS